MRSFKSRAAASLGFTLVELMVTVSVLAILAAIALPSFQGSLRSNRAATTTNAMIASLALARTEAIRGNQPVGVCPSADGLSCGADWSAGWIVWTDTNSDNTVNAGERVTRFSQGSASMVVTSAAAALRFDSRGRRTFPAGAAASTITLRPDECGGANLQRVLSVNGSGQVSKPSQPGACS